jgi:hypothetical protein
VWNKKWIKPGVDRVRYLFESQYKDKYLPPSKEQESDIVEEPSELEKWQRDLAIDTTTNELKSFIESTPITTNNPLTWWLDPINQEQFPCLSKMAVDVLSIHIMSADSERVFSGSRRMVTWERARLGVQSVERNECLKSWNISGLVDRTLFVAIDTTTSSDDTLAPFLEVM